VKSSKIFSRDSTNVNMVMSSPVFNYDMVEFLRFLHETVVLQNIVVYIDFTTKFSSYIFREMRRLEQSSRKKPAQVKNSLPR
jgi:hypothetical protein